MALVIEFSGRTGQANHMLRLDSEVVTVGRSFDNTVILKDPHVDPIHALLRVDPVTKSIRCIDNGSQNGIWVLDEKGKKKRIIGSTVLMSGQGLVLGRSKLRIYADNHVVEPAKPLSLWENYLAVVGNWWVIAGLALSLLAFIVLEGYIALPHTDKLFSFTLRESMTLFSLSLIYACIWGGIGKLSRHDMRFSVQLGIVLLAQTFWYIYNLLEPALLFNFEIAHWGVWLEKVLVIILSFCGVYLAATTSTHLAQRSRIAIAAVVPVGVLLMAFGDVIGGSDFSPRAAYDTSLVSPAWQWRDVVAEADFISLARDSYDQVSGDSHLVTEIVIDDVQQVGESESKE